MPQKLEDKIIKTIKDKNIKPLPRWMFLLEDYFLWGVFVFSLIVGSLAWAVVIYLIKSDWHVYSHWNGSFIEYMLKILPIFWLLVLAILSLLSWYNFKHTKKGYRYPFYGVIVLSIILSGILGSGFYALGAGEFVDYQLTQSLPVYNNYIYEHRLSVWLNPERGTLAGIIIKKDDTKSFTLKDFRGRVWTVYLPPTVLVHSKVQIKVNENIKMLGKQMNDFSFQAQEIRPWGTGCGLHRRQ